MGNKDDIRKLTERVRTLEQSLTIKVGGILSALDGRIGRLESVEPPPKPPDPEIKRTVALFDFVDIIEAYLAQGTRYADGDEKEYVYLSEALSSLKILKDAIRRHFGRTCKKCDYWLNCYPAASDLSGRCRLFSSNLNHKQMLVMQDGHRVRPEIVTRHDFYCNEYQPRKVGASEG